MSEILKSIVEELGIETGIAIAIIGSFLSLFVQIGFRVYDKKSNKQLASFKASLDREKKAYEFLITREFQAYEDMVGNIGNIIISIQELGYYLKVSKEEMSKRTAMCEKHSINVIEQLTLLRGNLLKSEPYISQSIYKAIDKLLIDVNQAVSDFSEIANAVYIENDLEKVIDKADDREREILGLCAETNYLIKDHLREISGQKCN